MTENTKTVTVPMAGAISILAAAIIITFGIFISPLFIGYKVYLYWGLCFIANIFVCRNKWYKKQHKKHIDNISTPVNLSLMATAGLMFWCGIIKFSQYWLPGGAEPFFHDAALFYVSFLVLFIVFWVILVFIYPIEQALCAIVDSFSLWATGFILMHFGMLLMLLIFEGD